MFNEIEDVVGTEEVEASTDCGWHDVREFPTHPPKPSFLFPLLSCTTRFRDQIDQQAKRILFAN
jgi:hypothetical protein